MTLRLAAFLVFVSGCVSHHAPLAPLVPTPLAEGRRLPPALDDAAPAPPLPEVHSARLDNGLTLWAAALPRRVVTACYVARRAGSDLPVAFADQPELLLEVIGEREPRIGESSWSGVAGDSLRLCVDGLPDGLPEMIARLASVVVDPRYDERLVERARERRLEHRERELRFTAALGAQLVQRWLVGPASALGAQVEDVLSAIHRFDAGWAATFHRRLLAPGDSALIVTGAVDPAILQTVVQEAFAGWRGSDERFAAVEPFTPPASDIDALIVETPLHQSMIFAGFPGPARFEADAAAFDVLVEVAVGAFGSRLNLALREREGASYGAFDKRLGRRGASAVLVMAGVDRDATVDAVRTIIEELSRLQTEPVAPGELAGAKARLREAIHVDAARTGPLAVLLADLFAAGLTVEELAAIHRRIDAVTVEAVLEAARRHLSRRTPMVVLATPPVAQELKRSELAVVIRSEENARRK